MSLMDMFDDQVPVTRKLIEIVAASYVNGETPNGISFTEEKYKMFKPVLIGNAKKLNIDNADEMFDLSEAEAWLKQLEKELKAVA